MYKKRLTADDWEARKMHAKNKASLYFQTNGKRPTLSTSVEWARTDYMLRDCGTSLARICDELGMPRRSKQRSFESIEADVDAFVEANGRHPNATRDASFVAHDKWLRRRGTSLCWLCAKKGYPSSVGGSRKKGIAA